jgi:hypothetical protein
MDEVGDACSTYGGAKMCIQGLMGKSEGRPLGKHRPRWEDNNKMHLREEGWKGLEGTNLSHGRDRRWLFVTR